MPGGPERRGERSALAGANRRREQVDEHGRDHGAGQQREISQNSCPDNGVAREPGLQEDDNGVVATGGVVMTPPGPSPQWNPEDSTRVEAEWNKCRAVLMQITLNDKPAETAKDEVRAMVEANAAFAIVGINRVLATGKPLSDDDPDVLVRMLHNITIVKWLAYKGDRIAGAITRDFHPGWFAWGGDHDDAIQELRMVAFKALEQYDPSRGRFTPWARGFLQKRASNLNRKHERHEERVKYGPDIPDVTACTNAGDGFLRVEDVDWYVREMRKPGVPAEAPLRLEGLEWDEIARMTESREAGAIARAFSRWVARRRQRYGVSDDDEPRTPP
jgi:DNA-directed RNA polymerase specialized sigma24 family protein